MIYKGKTLIDTKGGIKEYKFGANQLIKLNSTESPTNNETVWVKNNFTTKNKLVIKPYNFQPNLITDNTLMRNGWFNTNVVDWFASNGSISWVTGYCQLLGSGADVQVNVYQLLPVNIEVDEVIYIKARCRTTVNNPTTIRLGRGPASFTDGWDTQTNPVLNQWYTKSITRKAVAVVDNLQLLVTYANVGDATGGTVQVDYFHYVNLTKLFGKGHEPTTPQAVYNYMLGGTVPANQLNMFVSDGDINLSRISDTRNVQLNEQIRAFTRDVDGVTTELDYALYDADTEAWVNE